MRNTIAQGAHITITAAAAFTSGQFVQAGALSGVAQETVDAGAPVVLVRSGIVELPKLSAQAWTVGAKIYWDAAQGHCTTVVGSNVLIGAAMAIAVNPSADGIVLLDGTIR